MRLRDFIRAEFNVIASRFLSRTVDFIGFCEPEVLARGNNIRWARGEQEHMFTITPDYFDTIKKSNWSEDALSFYQTVISNVKM